MEGSRCDCAQPVANLRVPAPRAANSVLRLASVIHPGIIQRGVIQTSTKVHPAFNNKNLCGIVKTPVIALAGKHARARAPDTLS
jgi:hypothetical protein